MINNGSIEVIIDFTKPLESKQKFQFITKFLHTKKITKDSIHRVFDHGKFT